MMEQCPSCGTDLPANGQSCAYCGRTQLTTISTIAAPEQNVWVSPQTHEQLEKPVSQEITPNDQPSHVISETTKTVSPLLKGFILAAFGFITLGSIVTTFYFLNRPQPVIFISSEYQVGETLAGATGTVFHINGSKFSNSSAITFLLDGIPIQSSLTIYSDANGNINVDLPILEGWPLGEHRLTARDANNYTTEQGTIMIVPAGQAHTPGPNGAPPDDASFRIRIKILLVINTETGRFFVPNNEGAGYSIIGQPDPAGGSVCQTGTITNHSATYTNQNGDKITDTLTRTCGNNQYKGGNFFLIETIKEEILANSSGRTCILRKPYSAISVGTFINPTTMRGETNQSGADFDCTDSTSIHISGAIRAWEGQIVTD